VVFLTPDPAAVAALAARLDDDEAIDDAYLEARRRARLSLTAEATLTDDWFPEQAAFYNSNARLLAALCGRRAGKTRGLAAHFVRQALTTNGARLLYINHTLDECRRLFWVGNAQDGVYSLVQRHGFEAHADRTRLTLHFPKTDATIECRGAKDDTELSKALGSAYTEVAWDEAQKIRPMLAQTIREVLMPTLLDHAGRLRYTGTANRQQSGAFWDITKPTNKTDSRWEVHRWNMLANPHFGRAVRDERGQWWVYALKMQAPVSGPHGAGDIEAAVAGARLKFGIQQLAADLEVPVDSPIIQREGFGVWTPEDAAYVYQVRKMQNPFYAPARWRSDGFPDIAAALRDLPGDWGEYHFSLGADLGFRDAFALHCWAWHPLGTNLYELFSWKRSELDSDQQFAAIREAREAVALGQVVMDASGAGLATSVAWSKAFVERYGVPIVPAEKHQKAIFQDLYNTDITNERVRFRDGGETYEEAQHLQWSKLVTGTGKQIEDPTMDNHCCDASLYSHRASFAYRGRPADQPPPPGSPAAYARQAAELEAEYDQEDDSRDAYARYMRR
jgi:hypothetical protein